MANTLPQGNALRGVTMTMTIDEARRAANDAGRYILWLEKRQARLFKEPGWVKLGPARDGVVLFVHRAREIQTARQRGIL